MNCIKCNKQLNNPKAKYCSDKCRMSFNRAIQLTGTSSGNVNPYSVRPEQSLPEHQPEQNKVLRNETTTTDKTLNITKCPITEHRTDCLKCSHLKRKEKIKENEDCGEQYHDCKRWGVVIETYHLKMC